MIGIIDYLLIYRYNQLTRIDCLYIYKKKGITPTTGLENGKMKTEYQN